MISYFARNTFSRCDDLFPISCGSQDCSPSYSYGPAVRDHYVIHFVSRGLGYLNMQGKTYTVRAGEFFYIPPDTLAYYEADAEDPWFYTWVGMKGNILPGFFKKTGLSSENPIGKFTPELLGLAGDIFKNRKERDNDSLAAVGRLYMFLDCFERLFVRSKVSHNQAAEYVELAVYYIEKQLHTSISVSDIADRIGIDRSYLCSVFKKELNCSPQKYILERKMDKAKYFLSSTTGNVKYIALSLGYEDQFVFSRAFKAKTGVSPSEWRKRHPTLKK